MATYLLLFALLLAGGIAYAIVSSEPGADTDRSGGITRQENDNSVEDDDHHKIRR